VGLSLKTAPTVEPVTMNDLASVHLRVDGPLENALIANAITAARQWVEGETGRVLLTQTWELRFARFCGPWIELPKPPLIAVTSVTYLDSTGVRQTWDPTLWSFSAPAGERAERGRLFPIPYGIWPVALDFPDSIIVTFTAGYGPAAIYVPAALKQAVLLQTADFYQHREATITGTIVAANPAAKALVDPFRSKRFEVAA
jgi:uncharacterized phiE125 gp8 family phage protein